jgi:hypothetical protein
LASDNFSNPHPETAHEESWPPSTFVSEIIFLDVLLVLVSLENILDGWSLIIASSTQVIDELESHKADNVWYRPILSEQP